METLFLWAEQGFSPALILGNIGTLSPDHVIMYLAELRLTLALSGWAGRKRCALTKEELLHLLHDDLLVLAIRCVLPGD
jgi:hypothetical protein